MMARGDPSARPGLDPRRAFTVIERMAAILSVQHEFGSRELDVAGLMQVVVERSAQLTDASGAMLEIREKDESVVRCAIGLARGLIGHKEPAGEAISFRAVEGGQVYRSDETSRDPLLDVQLMQRIGAGSALLVPVQDGSKTSGVLTVFAPDARAFDDFDALTLRFMADAIVQGMQRWAQYKARHGLMDERTSALRGREASQVRADVLFASSPVPMAVLGEDLELTEVNEALCRAVGTHRDNLLFRHLPAMLHRDDAPTATASRETFTARVAKPDGSFIRTQLRLVALPTLSGRAPEVLAIFEDLQLAASKTAAPEPPAPRAAAPPLSHERVDVAILLSNALRVQRAGIHHNGLQVDTHIAPRLFVAGDGELLRFAFESLVASIIRSAPAHQSIVVRAGVLKAAIVVQFSGPGMVDGRIQRLFQPRAPLTQGRDGLGLEEAHRIVSLHGGRMWWKPGAEKGAVIGVALAPAK